MSRKLDESPEIVWRQEARIPASESLLDLLQKLPHADLAIIKNCLNLVTLFPKHSPFVVDCNKSSKAIKLLILTKDMN